MKYLIFLLLTFELTAQCKIKVDEFTKRESVQSKLQHIGQGQGLLGIDDQLECQFRRFENIKYVAFYVMGMHIQTIEKGEIVYLKFIDDSVMELNVEETTISDYFKSGSGGWYFWLYFTLNDSQISKLSTTPLKKIRVHYIDYNISSRNNKKLMEQIDCVLNAKPPKSNK